MQKLKWNVPIRPETDAADIAMFTSRSLLRSKGVQGHSPVPLKAKNVAAGVVDGAKTDVSEQQASSNGQSGNGNHDGVKTDVPAQQASNNGQSGNRDQDD